MVVVVVVMVVMVVMVVVAVPQRGECLLLVVQLTARQSHKLYTLCKENKTVTVTIAVSTAVS